MHPSLGECYILTFSLTAIKGNNGKNSRRNLGEYIFDDLQFSFNVNKNYGNEGCRGILANLGVAILKFSKLDATYEILTKPKIPWKVLIPIKCFSKSNVNKIDYAFHQSQTKDIPFMINKNKSVGAINFKYGSNLEYNIILQSNNMVVTIFNPLAYRIRSEIDYLKAQIKEIIIEEPLKEVINFKGTKKSLGFVRPIDSLFNFSYQLDCKTSFQQQELDESIQEKLQQQYGHSLLESQVSSIFKDYYLNNNKTIKINGLIKYDNKTMLYSHNFVDTINLNDTSDEKQPINPNWPVLILPANFNNWRGGIDSKIYLKTINILLTVNIFQDFNFKNSLLNNVNVIIAEPPLTIGKTYYQDFVEKLIIDIEQIKWWFIKRIISNKEYKNFILGINNFEDY